jgi:hypothetical protein
MNIIDDKDNIFAEGTLVHAKATPDLTLRIIKYQQRVYFCSASTEPVGKLLPYFERELESAAPTS